MASDIPENTPDLTETPITRREQLTQALLDILEGEDSQREGEPTIPYFISTPFTAKLVFVVNARGIGHYDNTGDT